MMQRDDLLNAVLAMPLEDRAYIADALEHSLAGSADKAAFVQELDRRMEAHRRNPESARLAADVLADLRKRQADQAS